MAVVYTFKIDGDTSGKSTGVSKKTTSTGGEYTVTGPLAVAVAMLINAALEAVAVRAEEMAEAEDTNTRCHDDLLQALGRHDMAQEIAAAARAMKTTHGAPNA